MLPISRYVPGYGGGARDLVTPWHVLTHTSGIPDVGLEHIARGRPSFQTMLDRVRAEMPTFEPGSRYSYASNPWYLLAAMITTLTGMPFPVALRQRVLAPLGMVDTSFDPRPTRARTQQVHGVRIDNFVAREFMVRFLASATLPGGGLFGPAEDMLRFGRSMLPRDTVPAERRAHPVPGGHRRDDPGADGRHPGVARRRITCAAPTTHLAGTRQARTWPAQGRRTRSRCTAYGSRLRRTSFTHAGASGTRLWVDPAAGPRLRAAQQPVDRHVVGSDRDPRRGVSRLAQLSRAPAPAGAGRGRLRPSSTVGRQRTSRSPAYGGRSTRPIQGEQPTTTTGPSSCRFRSVVGLSPGRRVARPNSRARAGNASSSRTSHAIEARARRTPASDEA